MAIFKTDRPLFLINFISFVFLPGLVYSVFTRLGVSPRVAWCWMWLVPTGYCFVLQAGSIGCDLFGAVFALAAVDFALRAKASFSARDFFAATVAAALMTSAKPSNLPLLLPWLLAILPAAGLLWRWPWRVMLVGFVALLASYLPTALLNWHYCGDWTGLKVETGVAPKAPFFLIGVNTFLLAIQNLTPPVFPFDGWWYEFFVRHLPAGLAARLDQLMESGLRSFNVPLLQIEEGAGLGFGVSAMLLASLVAGGFARLKSSGRNASLWMLAVRWSPLFSLLVLMTQSRYVAISREISPYYVFLLPLVLTRPGQTWLVRCRWWRRGALLVFALAAGLLVVSPARPLLPVQWFLNFPSLPAKARVVYSVYHGRNDAFAPARAIIPADLKTLGLFTYDDPEASLWRPFGSVRIEHICPSDTLADLQQRGIQYVFLSEANWLNWFKIPPEAWRQQMNAQLVGKVTLTLKVSKGPGDWLLFKLPRPNVTF
jgi:hypothetical protein